MKLVKSKSTVVDAVQLIHETARQAAYNDPYIKKITGALLCGAADPVNELSSFLSEDLTFLPDPAGLQIVKSPKRLIIDGSGNCVDITVLLAAVGYRLELPVSFMVASFDGVSLTHIYPKIGGDVYDVTMYMPGGGGLSGFKKNIFAPAVRVLEFF